MPRYNSQRQGTVRTLPKLIVSFYVLFVCKCVLYYCHWVSTRLHLTNISISIYLKIICAGGVTCYFPQHVLYIIILSFCFQIIFIFYIKGTIKFRYTSHRINVNFVGTSVNSFCWKQKYPFWCLSQCGPS